MSKLEDLVPPLELCKLIPVGEFRDSEYSYAYKKWIEKPKELYGETIISTTHIVRSADGFSPDHEKNPSPEFWEFIHTFFPTCHVCKAHYPAPTLQEIMAAMPYCRVYKKTSGIFIAVHNKTRIAHMDGATAALKLWLKLKGVEA